MRWSLFAAVSVIVVAAAVAAVAGDPVLDSAAADTHGPGRDAPLAAQPGDVLSVSVFGHNELSRRVRVAPDGSIVYPFVGSVAVVGHTHDAVARRIESALRDEYQMRSPRVFVTVETIADTVVYVAGEVATAGAHTIGDGTGVSLLQALAVAGGPGEDADLRAVRVHRAGEAGPGRSFDISGGSTAAASARLSHGDTVFVPRARRISVLGDISQPGTFPHDAGAPWTLVRLIAHAGGFARTADRQRIVWISGDGENRVVRHVDATQILSGVADDVVLAPGDLIVVGSRTVR